MSGEVLGNIPRLCTAFSDWVACLLYISLLPRRFHGVRLWGAAALFLAVKAFFLQLTDGYDGVWFNLFMLLSALLSLAFVWAICEISVCGAVYYTARSFILAGFAGSLAWQLYSFSLPRLPLLRSLPAEALFLGLVVLLAQTLVYLLERRNRAQTHALRITLREGAGAAIVAVAIYIISSLSYASVETPFGSSTAAEAFNIRTMVYLGGVAILYAYHLQLSELHARIEVEALQGMLRMQHANYEASRESIELVNQKYHDLKHQIEVLRSQGMSEKASAYLDRMEDEIKAYEAQNKTGNPVLDTVLTGKGLRCQNLGIHLTCVADGEALSFMDEMDISSLFGNMLDNAIESASKLAAEEKRLIHLSVARQKGFVHIRAENCYEGALVYEGGLPSTTKRDKRYHGYGLKSMQSTARKYGGSVTIGAENGWFELRVLLPVPGEKK